MRHSSKALSAWALVLSVSVLWSTGGCHKGKNVGKGDTGGKFVFLSTNQRAGDVDEAMSKVENMKALLADADGVYAPNEPTTFGMLRGLQNLKLAGKVRFVGFDGGKNLADGLAGKQIDALVLQDPVRMGYLGVQTLIDHLRGKTVPPTVDTGCRLATPDNMNTEAVKGLLVPEVKASAPEGVPATQGKEFIAVIPKGTTHVFWQSVEAGARKAAAESGVEMIWKAGVKEDDLDAQVTVIEAMISRGVSGIVLAPVHSTALAKQVANAKKKGIPVVVIDSALEGHDYVSFVATDSYKGGQMAAAEMIRLLPHGGRLVVLRYLEGHVSTAQREQGFIDGIEAFNKTGGK
ncbi:MAG: substrate-binding domain-containing protein [Planctomycetota bacterium]|nr:substrate-binding domain-containing protein [Planctomycetota bacterium]